MPPIVWVFVALMGLAHGHTLITGVPHGVDPSVQLKTKKTPILYHVWTAPRWRGVAGSDGFCHVRFFALKTGIKSCRLTDGEEQLLDTSWTFDRKVQKGTALTKQFWFIDPVTRETLAYRKVTFTCYVAYEPPPQTNWNQRRIR
jgi:hypothetical protein